MSAAARGWTWQQLQRDSPRRAESRAWQGRVKGRDRDPREPESARGSHCSLWRRALPLSWLGEPCT